MAKPIRQPLVWRQLCLGVFNQDFDVIYPLLPRLCDGLSEGDRGELARFLDHLLADSSTNGDLRRAFKVGGAQITLQPDRMRPLLESIKTYLKP